ncbi:MAG: Phosphoribosylformylglycinamidine synthase, purS [Parcubacteria group bacterium GW2011_GWC2_42_12]|uniref:Phosphoribosylformylglycinamidine synthase subunit PurS n=1 Tax=Candidatus Falkowbacteria bacterium GW2011_GWA2_41_14 TaxID=1618635 RepID=A0A0G0USU2_9BACT|nr:MAG: Phosphoribosylformylglycinamidine synthase, purS [Candidatus Falkowbacteria bacterium GW2011_GWA2_41_14]KKS33879.1 MAG: Phosphoribosylformylglycinamidine synthase, purS [Parcubacteria group bacterium GW2011_GWC2_42_12]
MRKFQVTVYVFRKVGCSNPEESTTLAALHRLDLQVISGIRMGRCFLLSVDAQDEIDAGQAAQTACKKLLANLVMEQFEIVGIRETK